ncbi:MAG: single-stranded-DNA-specific exonuclease RecJ [Thermodesulfobacteriota bacterium]|nr:single-stranded-DNA-specific exonuclease RecJ [Thermodesulfobacteriota bacterium]
MNARYQSKKWNISSQDEEKVALLARALKTSPILARVLINRGSDEVESATRFLNPKLSGLSHPFLIRDMEQASHHLARAIRNGKKITIFGDYDVDGVTGTSILHLFIKHFNGNVDYYIPDRKNEGYGLNIPALCRIVEQGTELVVTVDCGIGNINEARFLSEKGVDLIITDHHEIPQELPSAQCIVNPKLGDENSPLRHLAGCGVAFYLALGTRLVLRESGYFKDNLPNLKEYLDLVALGTLADILPLSGDNRILVQYGLKQLINTKRPGIAALRKVCSLSLTKEISTEQVNFLFAPRLNAAGRMGSAIEAVKLLTTDDPYLAKEIAESLNEKNNIRQRIEDETLCEAIRMIEEGEDDLYPESIVLARESWDIGVLGIVASRVMEEYYKPTVLFNYSSDLLRGSARSIKSFHLYDGLCQCKDLLLSFGGHKYAAGLRMETNNLGMFRMVFNDIVKSSVIDGDFIPEIELDATITLDCLNARLLREMSMMEPFGPGNPEPTFSTHDLVIEDVAIFNNKHLRLKVREGDSVYSAIGFRMGKNLINGECGHKEGQDVFPLWCKKKKAKLAFTPFLNEWQGIKSIQLRLKDIRFVDD